MKHVIQPESIEKWPLEKHVGVMSKLLVDAANMTVLWSRWEPNASAPEHIHPHEQIGICLEGEMVFTINGQEYTVKAGEFYHIPGNTPHAERNDSPAAATLTDFFSPVRNDLLHKHFEPKLVGEDTSTGTQQKGGDAPAADLGK
jgi:quercetin dioxygenase-like cupin family protein